MSTEYMQSNVGVGIDMNALLVAMILRGLPHAKFEYWPAVDSEGAVPSFIIRFSENCFTSAGGTVVTVIKASGSTSVALHISFVENARWCRTHVEDHTVALNESCEVNFPELLRVLCERLDINTTYQYNPPEPWEENK